MTSHRISLKLATPESGVGAVTAAHHVPARRRGANVLLAPGAGGDLDGEGLVALAEVFADLGHHVVRVNLPYREAGKRAAPKAERSVAGFVQVAAAARSYVGGTNDWIVGGKSYGGRVASLAVAGGLPAAGLVFYGYPLHPPGKPDRLRVDHWPDLGVPCLFLQGSRDTFCELGLLRAHLRKLARRPTLQVVEGGDHSLKVAKMASSDGQAVSATASISALSDEIATWIQGLAG